ncbi:dTDP-4-dehydrorhamnose 3,5-epimerase family protein, partial [Succinatimonas hippei]
MMIEQTSIPEVLLITNKKFGDNRGWFSEVFRLSEFEKAIGGQYKFVQINESFSMHNILRGIHYQNP